MSGGLTQSTGSVIGVVARRPRHAAKRGHDDRGRGHRSAGSERGDAARRRSDALHHPILQADDQRAQHRRRIVRVSRVGAGAGRRRRPGRAAMLGAGDQIDARVRRRTRSALPSASMWVSDAPFCQYSVEVLVEISSGIAAVAAKQRAGASACGIGLGRGREREPVLRVEAVLVLGRGAPAARRRPRWRTPCRRPRCARTRRRTPAGRSRPCSCRAR